MSMVLRDIPKLMDEATIGLDVVTKRNLRACIRQINKERNTTIILTTHDMNDIEAVCSRIILIDQGKKLFDGDMDHFRKNYASGVEFLLEFSDTYPDWVPEDDFQLAECSDLKWKIIYKGETKASSDLCIYLINKYHPDNIWVSVPSIENIVADFYMGGAKNG